MVRSLPHRRHATLLDVLLHFQTYVYVMLPSWTFSCTCTHTSATHALALPHIRHATLLGVLLHFHIRLRHATLLDVLLHFRTYVMLRCWTFCHCCYSTRTHVYVMLGCWTFLCPSTHTSCYAAGRSVTVALPHTRLRHATLLDVLLHFHTYVMVRCWTFSCTSTHTSCYPAGHPLALPHIRLRHSTLLDVLLHFHTYVMVRCWTFCHCNSTH